MVPGDDHARNALVAQAQEEVEHGGLGVGAGVARVEQVAGHQDHVGAFRAGQSGNLGQGVVDFRGAVEAPQGSPGMEIGSVKYAHHRKK